MPKFTYRAKNGPDSSVQGTVDASDQSDAIRKIVKMGLAPVVVEADVSASNGHTAHTPAGTAQPEPVPQIRMQNLIRSVPLKLRQSKEKKVIAFSRYLAGFLRNGIPILKAMQILSAQEKDPAFRSVLKSVESDLKKGKSFSAALSEHSVWFSEVYIMMVRSGESGSALEQTLLILSNYLKRAERTRTKVTQAMIYPAFLGISGFATVIFIMAFVVPRLTTLFENIGQELPLITRIIMSAGQFFSTIWPLLLILTAAFALTYRRMKTAVGKERWDRIRMQIPYFGNLALKSDMAKFCRALQMSAANGIPFLRALSMAEPIVSLSNIRAHIRSASQQVEKGGRLGEALKQRAEIPSFMCDMISIGEDSGNLESMLEEVSELYEEEVDDKIQTVTSVLEPLMILVIGIFVGFVVMAMLLPVFEMDVMQQ